jgi:hypothetical protein
MRRLSIPAEPGINGLRWFTKVRLIYTKSVHSGDYIDFLEPHHSTGKISSSLNFNSIAFDPSNIL